MNWFQQETMACCPDCGVWVPAAALRDGEHECAREVLVEFQVLRARRQLVRFEWELACYLQTPRARKLLAFRRYLERRAAAGHRVA